MMNRCVDRWQKSSMVTMVHEDLANKEMEATKSGDFKGNQRNSTNDSAQSAQSAESTWVDLPCCGCPANGDYSFDNASDSRYRSTVIRNCVRLFKYLSCSVQYHLKSVFLLDLLMTSEIPIAADCGCGIPITIFVGAVQNPQNGNI